ncbi:hypothetical protein C8F04DRAFT_1188093 [Mycena alexandri]|uniref:Uncharacterized protein n=1 Tax=Mycena alexandri TaxID=1745969 RepID=A0AAD6SL64_9AGAR|nr:hypothetical protein C8F04DRAFT_1188093 [Mycena alexandri]
MVARLRQSLISPGSLHKVSYIKKYWDEPLQKEAMKNLEKTFKERHFEQEQTAASRQTTVSEKAELPSALRRTVSFTPDDPTEEVGSNHADPSRPWRDEFQLYINMREAVPAGMSSIAWWGVRLIDYTLGSIWE